MTSSPTQAVDPWRRTASMASHPSRSLAVLDDQGDLLAQIAAGLGDVVVPAELLGRPSLRLERELLLTTPAYDVWMMQWPAGTSVDPHSHDDLVAFHVVSGELVETRPDVAPLLHHTHPAGSTVVLPAHVRHQLRSARATTTVHVHAKRPAR